MLMKSSSRFLIYMCYGLVLTIVLLYIRFPSEEFRAYCEKQAETTLDISDCTIEKIGYSFPISIAFTNVNLEKTVDEKNAKILIDRLAIRPALKFWKTYRISGNVYTGSFRATLKIGWNEKVYTFTDITLTDLSLSKILSDQAIDNRKIEGRLDGSGSYQANWSSSEEKAAKARFAITKGSFELLQPVLSLSLLEYDKINFDVHLAEQLEIKEGKLRGKDINATFDGSVNVMNTLQDSRIRLSGLLEPKREFLQANPREAKMVRQYAKRFRKNALPFKMGGTMANPTFRFSR